MDAHPCGLRPPRRPLARRRTHRRVARTTRRGRGRTAASPGWVTRPRRIASSAARRLPRGDHRARTARDDGSDRQAARRLDPRGPPRRGRGGAGGGCRGTAVRAAAEGGVREPARAHPGDREGDREAPRSAGPHPQGRRRGRLRRLDRPTARPAAPARPVVGHPAHPVAGDLPRRRVDPWRPAPCRRGLRDARRRPRRRPPGDRQPRRRHQGGRGALPRHAARHLPAARDLARERDLPVPADRRPTGRGPRQRHGPHRCPARPEAEEAPLVIDVELTDPHHVTAGYTGVPGDRTFFVQFQDEAELVTLAVEKAQVVGLGELLAQLLVRVDDAPATDWDRAAMELRDPIEPRWRVGAIQVGLDPERGRFVLEFGEVAFVEDEDDEDDEPEPREVRVWADQDQARRLAAHCAEVVEQGRPRCQLCGRPTEADGSHVCPATNGHGRLTR
ncbi:DUF3090 family protein [Nitriliruptoraceae bacterium ZYF776]|nr:DUF3090 family protein [Profundirhabdus halotolerans]